MCELFAVSSKLPTKITFSLEEFASHGGKKAHHTDGWGLAFYDGPFAQIFHEAKPSAYSEWMKFLQNHQPPSCRIISNIKHAT
ncbi:MAG: class II glutamine amidotransferase, partial [Kangiellaceae bacterium]|nr:class II glutamine amidotransferase [Kangiellaceae bacterium]